MVGGAERPKLGRPVPLGEEAGGGFEEGKWEGGVRLRWNRGEGGEEVEEG
jgi:hypothetical protein